MANRRAPLLTVSVAAELAGMHAQTLRQYDRLGLVSARRTRGGGRRYSLEDVERLQEIQRMSQEDGINLAGIARILQMQERIDQLTAPSSAPNKNSRRSGNALTSGAPMLAGFSLPGRMATSFLPAAIKIYANICATRLLSASRSYTPKKLPGLLAQAPRRVPPAIPVPNWLATNPIPLICSSPRSRCSWIGSTAATTTTNVTTAATTTTKAARHANVPGTPRSTARVTMCTHC